MNNLNLPFKFFVPGGDELTYSCDVSPTSWDHLSIRWTEEDEQECFTEYTREEVSNFIDKGLWIIVGEDNA